MHACACVYARAHRHIHTPQAAHIGQKRGFITILQKRLFMIKMSIKETLGETFFIFEKENRQKNTN